MYIKNIEKILKKEKKDNDNKVLENIIFFLFVLIGFLFKFRIEVSRNRIWLFNAVCLQSD